ncbi:AGC protein kinase [Sphaeroforma arctica JP610]|uniref:AGC protein kinase n=1 Tax=Sphaeroforma arctica JP610 TaxID=667725 RepID=A0A0L0FPI7_9EUKA|nr:AGC protein kinase [Sphaeroforma arctica JP610]KNC78619.1 AGC protein kinase [Sphaeroforma arctica JP610]|eukprot:XP_014152521.1 AGC protein kinase [Sphaeroforma arctica JP610]
MREEQITLIELARKDIPFAIKTIGAFKDGDKLYFIMEEAQGGGLFDILRHAKDHHFTEKVAKFYAAECLIFLKYLHQQAHVVYRDLKPENLMVDREGHLVIIDFGLCKHLEDGERTMSFVGTPDYMAPEIIKGSPYSFEVDFWSFGCLIFEMINGYSPFETKDEQGNLTFTNIMKHSNEPRRHRHGVSPEARMLIDHLLQANRQSRLGRHRGWTAVQAHPWFQNVDWKCCAEKRLKPPKVPKFRQKVMENQPSVDSVGLEGQEIKDAFESFDCVVRAEPQTPTSKLGKQPIFSVSFVEEKNVVNVNKDDDLVHLIQEARLEESHSKECSSQLPNAKDSSTSPARSPPIADQSSSENVLLDVSQVLHVTGKPGHAGQDSTTHKGKKKRCFLIQPESCVKLS